MFTTSFSADINFSDVYCDIDICDYDEWDSGTSAISTQHHRFELF